jgi:hypothetical protein
MQSCETQSRTPVPQMWDGCPLPSEPSPERKILPIELRSNLDALLSTCFWQMPDRERMENAAARGLQNAGVVQWQNVSFPSSTRGFDSLHPLQVVHNKELIVRPNASKRLTQNTFSEQVQDRL